MALLYSNNGASTLASGITTSTQTSIVLATGHGTRFPSPTGGDHTFITVENGAGAVETICIVGRSTDTLTVGIPGSAAADAAGRGQEGTTATTWITGDIVEGRATAAVIARGGNAKTATELAAAGGAALIGNQPAGSIAATTVQAAIDELASEKVQAATLAATGGAASVGNTPAGNIAATTVQAAINELDSEKMQSATLAASGGAALVGNTPAGNLAATTVQAAINELDSEKAKLNGDPAQAFSASTFTGALAGNADTATKAGIPQNSQSAAYTTVLADANKHILHPASDNFDRTFTIASNGTVAYPIGTTLTFVNEIATLTISISADTMVLAGVGSTGNRTLAVNGVATAIKVTSTKWYISGSGLS